MDENIEATDQTPELRRPQDEIRTVRHVQRMGHEDFVRMRLGMARQLHAMPDKIATGVAVQARIDHGRWLVDCPGCPGAELVDLEDLRFFCLSCKNQAANGMWLPVVIPGPEERAGIEKAILERPAQFRHWRPGETVADVQTTNITHEAW